MGNVESYLTDGMQVEQRQVPVRNTVTRRCAARPARQPQVGDAVRPVKTIATASQSKTPWNYYTSESKLDKFEEENQRLEEALKRLRQRRLLAFQQELAEFERSNDPFSILGIEATDDADAIKRAYKRQSLRYHPDKGGSEEQFAMITRAYVYIMKKLDRLQYKLATDSNMKSSAQEFVQEQERQPRENIYVDRMKFDPKVFNRVFDDNKMADVNDDGYADIMTSGPRSERDVEVENVFNGKFNREVFQSEFEERKHADQSADIVVYEEPKPLVSSGLNYYELGVDRVGDYGKPDRLNTEFSDYKLAHGRGSKLINPADVQHTVHRSVEDLKVARKQIKHDLSPEEEHLLRTRRQREELEEAARQLRVSEQDALASQHYERMNKVFIQG